MPSLPQARRSYFLTGGPGELCSECDWEKRETGPQVPRVASHNPFVNGRQTLQGDILPLGGKKKCRLSEPVSRDLDSVWGNPRILHLGSSAVTVWDRSATLLMNADLGAGTLRL